MSRFLPVVSRKWERRGFGGHLAHRASRAGVAFIDPVKLTAMCLTVWAVTVADELEGCTLL